MGGTLGRIVIALAFGGATFLLAIVGASSLFRATFDVMVRSFWPFGLALATLGTAFGYAVAPALSVLGTSLARPRLLLRTVAGNLAKIACFGFGLGVVIATGHWLRLGPVLTSMLIPAGLVLGLVGVVLLERPRYDHRPVSEAPMLAQQGAGTTKKQRRGWFVAWLVSFIAMNAINGAMLAMGDGRPASPVAYASIAIHLAAIVCAIALLRRQRAAFPALVSVALCGIAVGVFDGVRSSNFDVLSTRGWASAYMHLATLGFNLLFAQFTNVWPELGERTASSTKSSEGRGQSVLSTASGLTVALRGIAYMFACALLVVTRLLAWHIKWCLTAALLGGLLVGMASASEHGFDKRILCVGAWIVLPPGWVFVLMPLSDMLGDARGDAAVLQSRLFDFAIATLRRPRVLASHARRAAEILAKDEPFTLLLRSWTPEIKAVHVWSESLASRQPVLTLMAPKTNWSGDVITPAMSYFWWGESIREYIRRARSILIVGTTLSPGLRWEIERVVEEGSSERALVISLPRSVHGDLHDPELAAACAGKIANIVRARGPFLAVPSVGFAEDPELLVALARWASNPEAPIAELRRRLEQVPA